MNKTIVTRDNAYIGMKVVRGRDWDWDWSNQGGSSKFGTITDSFNCFPRDPNGLWVDVKWENGCTYPCRIGAGNKFGLYVYEEEFVLPEKWCVDATSEEAGDWFDFQSGSKIYSKPNFSEGFLHSENSNDQKIINKGSLVKSFHDYGIRPGFTQITIEQFKKYVMKETSETVTLSVYQMNEIVRMACVNWKNTLREEFWDAISTQKELVITKVRFQQYLDASTKEQKERFTELFPDQFKPVLPDIKPGTLVYVRHSDGTWMMRYFSHFNKLGEIYVYTKQKREGETQPWNEYSFTNPLEE